MNILEAALRFTSSAKVTESENKKISKRDYTPLRLTSSKEVDYEQNNVQLAYNAKILQSAIIKNQKPNTTEQVLNQEALRIYQQYGSQEQTIKLGDKKGKSEYKIKPFSNDIVLLQQRKRTKNLFLFFKKYSVEEFYFIDKKNNKAWDVKKMLDEKKGDKPYELVICPSLTPQLLQTNKGHSLVINLLDDINQKDRKRIIRRLKFSKKEEQILSLIAPLHEMGHHLQLPTEKTNDNMEMTLIKMFLIKTFLMPLAKLMMKFSFIPTFIRKRGVWQERNAHAFDLSLIHKLKSEGVNLLRGFSLKEITQTTDKALFSYDFMFGKILVDPFYSQRLRRIKKEVLKEDSPKKIAGVETNTS